MRIDFSVVNTFAIALTIVAATCGCATRSSEPATDSQASAVDVSPASDEPRTITDLSQISAAAAMPASVPQLNPNPSVPSGGPQNARVQENIERMFVANVDHLRYREGRSPGPANTGLLNDKAREFSEFSYQLLNQTLSALQSIASDRLAGRKLPEDIAPIVLTAVLDSQGRLTEIAIESHSGDHQVDQIIIDSCKQGLWSRNPPSQALGADGMYRIRVRGYIRAYSIDIRGRYKYENALGLGIL